MEDADPYLNILAIGAEVTLDSLGLILGLAVIVFLFLISALVSGSEVAFFSLTPTDLDKIKYNKGKTSGIIEKLLDNPERLLATILITNNFVNVGIVILSSYLTLSILEFKNDLVAFIIQVVVITFLILFFCEILPKVYANRYTIAFARLTAPGLQFFSKIFRPVSSILIRSTSFFNKRLIKTRKQLSVDELSDVLELTESTLVEEKSILEGIVKFGNIDVSEIMRSRLDVVSVDIQTSFKELINIVNTSGYSRIPVFEESFDKIKGILYIKDLLPHLNKTDNFRWQSLIRPPYYVPDSKKINDLLKEFQLKRIHMAVVVDEYGGSSGIITLEDILEEIVGEITDETDEEESFFQKIDHNHYIFQAKIQLNDFYKVVGIDDSFFSDIKGDADTLAGLILELRGEIPKIDDKISYKNFVFRIREVDNRRIIKIEVTIKRQVAKE